MTTDKLHTIIAQKNEQLERDALRRASQIIDEIAEEQAIILKSQKNISELRTELTSLQVEQINPVSILG
jgi:hypothetical protein